MSAERDSHAFALATIAASCVTTAAFVPLMNGLHSQDYWVMQLWLPAWATIFGYLGAALFLWPAFSVASMVRTGSWDYPVAGAFAGIAHTFAARLAVPHSDSDPGFLMWLGGFQLASFLGAGPFEIFRLMLPACLGGLAAGWIYDRAIGRDVLVKDQLSGTSTSRLASAFHRPRPAPISRPCRSGSRGNRRFRARVRG